MSYTTIQASELGAYLYCRRAWWLRRNAGRSGEHVTWNPSNVDQLTAGLQYHKSFHRKVKTAGCANRLALILLFFAVAFLTFWLVRTL